MQEDSDAHGPAVVCLLQGSVGNECRQAGLMRANLAFWCAMLCCVVSRDGSILLVRSLVHHFLRAGRCCRVSRGSRFLVLALYSCLNFLSVCVAVLCCIVSCGIVIFPVVLCCAILRPVAWYFVVLRCVAQCWLRCGVLG